MNILHHKSWHVRTKKNIEKVRNDEKKDLEIQIEKARKADISEQERRIEKLRNKFDKNKNNETKEKNNLNFFEKNYDAANNKSFVLEKKLEQQEWEKKVGILSSLGKKSDKDIPWYEQDPEKNSSTLNYKEIYHVEYQDPLKKMKKDLKKSFPEKEKFLKMKFNKYEKNINKYEKNINKYEKNINKYEKNINKYEKDINKYEKNINNEKKYKLKKDEINEDPKIKELKILREKRLKREKKNAERVKMLFTNKNVFPSCDRERNYTNQFNPHLAKKN